MEDGDEFTGRSVEDAIAQARSELGQDVEIEVVSQGTRGVFGIGAEPARIRARRRDALTQQPAPTRAERIGQAEPAAERSGAAAVATPKRVAARPSLDGAELATEASEVLRELLRCMGFEVEISVQNPENPLTLAVSGNNLGVLIGRRGDNLAALQFMVNLILSKHRRQWPRVVLDIENYRARREESLRTLADRIAYRVRRNGRPFTLEAMPASDRRIIHLALRDRPEVETYSIGEGPARRVVIAPKRVTRDGPGRDF